MKVLIIDDEEDFRTVASSCLGLLGGDTVSEACSGKEGIEMARTDEERMTGLMYRKELAEGKGMLFDFAPEQRVSMWMKNTFIPLDMIFIRSDGRILRIAENTEPHSEKIISSGGLAKGVLEVIGGTARKYGIQAGDRVAHPLFGTR